MISPRLGTSVKERYSLIEVEYLDSRDFKDILIYREGHKPSRLETKFIDILKSV
jgi:hypothetical protein